MPKLSEKFKKTKGNLSYYTHKSSIRLDVSKKDAEKPVILKPSISGESTGRAQVGNSVNTSDTTNVWVYMSMIIVSFWVLAFVMKTKRLNRK